MLQFFKLCPCLRGNSVVAMADAYRDNSAEEIQVGVAVHIVDVLILRVVNHKWLVEVVEYRRKQVLFLGEEDFVLGHCSRFIAHPALRWRGRYNTFMAQLNPTIRHSVCALDCPDACGLLINVDNGTGSKLRGDPAHPVTRGFLCGKVAQYLDREYSPDRLLYPTKRVTRKKGEGKFARIGWDEAIET